MNYEINIDKLKKLSKREQDQEIIKYGITAKANDEEKRQNTLEGKIHDIGVVIAWLAGILLAVFVIGVIATAIIKWAFALVF